MKKSLLIVWMSIWCVVAFSQENKIVSGVIGGISLNGYQDKLMPGNKVYSLPDMQFSFHVGYQFQIPLKHRFSVDAALLYGQKRGKLKPAYGFETMPVSGYTEKFSRNYIALDGVVNYNLVRGFKLGAGVEPTLHFKESILVDNTIQSAFDIPVVVKAAYSFKYFEVAFMYKHGTCNVLKGMPYLKSGRTRDLQLSVFIPIFR